MIERVETIASLYRYIRPAIADRYDVWKEGYAKLASAYGFSGNRLADLPWWLEEKTYNDEMNGQNQLVIISGPHCVGKSTVRKALQGLGVHYVPNVTTRNPRPGEIPGDNYYFLTPHQFDELDQNNELLSKREDKDGTMMGFTVHPFVDKLYNGQPVFLEKTLHSSCMLLQSLQERFPDLYRQIDHRHRIVFLLPPGGPHVLALRALNRAASHLGDNSQNGGENHMDYLLQQVHRPLMQWQLLEESKRVMDQTGQLTYLVNDELPRIVDKIVNLLP